MRSYAIGDIHGQYQLLLAAHARIAADRTRVGDTGSPVIHLGDLVDRGPESAAVIAHLRHGIAEGQPWTVLCGNHDRMFAGFMADPGWQDPGLRAGRWWLHPHVGGAATLASYGISGAESRPAVEVQAEARARVPQEDIAFLRGLPLFRRRDEILFVHAGIRPGVALAEQTEDDLVWIRDGFLDDPRDHGFLVVHGHTAIERARHFGNRVDLDSSAAYGGPLTAAVIEGREIWLLEDEGRVPLRPEAGPEARRTAEA